MGVVGVVGREVYHSRHIRPQTVTSTQELRTSLPGLWTSGGVYNVAGMFIPVWALFAHVQTALLQTLKNCSPYLPCVFRNFNPLSGPDSCIYFLSKRRYTTRYPTTQRGPTAAAGLCVLAERDLNILVLVLIDFLVGVGSVWRLFVLGDLCAAFDRKDVDLLSGNFVSVFGRIHALGLWVGWGVGVGVGRETETDRQMETEREREK